MRKNRLLHGNLLKIFIISAFLSLNALAIYAQNYALKLDRNSVIKLTETKYSGKTWTVEAWVKKDASFPHSTFLAKGNDIKLNLETWNNTKKIGYTFRANNPADVTFNYQLPINRWTHIAFVQKEKSLALYINGVLKDSKSVNFSLPMSSIGSANETFVGAIDEVRVWQTARTAQQLVDNMNRSVPTNDSDLLSYWYFDDKAPNITDLSAHGISGAVGSATYVINSNSKFKTTLPKMSFESVNATLENEYFVKPNSTKQELLSVVIKSSGVVSPIKLEQLTINTNGTSSISDLKNVSLFYSNGTKKLILNNRVAEPQNGAKSISFSCNVPLLPGANYFWIVADVAANATPKNFVAATLESVVVNGKTHLASKTETTAKRQILKSIEENVAGRSSIIPEPYIYTALKGEFTLNKDTKIQVAESAIPEAKLFAEYLKSATGFNLKIEKFNGKTDKNSICLRINEKLNSKNYEAYKLISSTDSVVVEGVNPKAIFWGTQTIRQMLPYQIESKSVVDHVKWTIPGARIIDLPRFHFRGFLFDVGRHFFSVDYIKKFIDYLSYYKYNVFHWHFVEDQGWRVEVKKYPRLTEIGSVRDCGTGLYGSEDGKPYGGFYTQEQIKEVVAYAAARNVEIIPEIELPGHSSEILAAYPEFACFKQDGSKYPLSKVKCTGGVFDDIICGGKDISLQFYKDVLDELLPLFPSKYVHIGGDEAPKSRWKVCPDCQAKIKKLGLSGDKKEEALQRYIFEEIGKYIQSKGKEYIGWSEIAHSGNIPNGAILQDWIGGTDLALKTGHKVIRSSYYGALYIAQRQSNDPSEPSGPGAVTTLEQTYKYEPVPNGYSPAQQSLVMGSEVCMWTEHIKTESHFDYMSSPRVQAHAELSWSPKVKRNFNIFNHKLLSHYLRLQEMGLNFRRVERDTIIHKTLIIDKPTEIEAPKTGISYYWNNDTFATTKKITVSKSGIYKCYINYYGQMVVAIFDVKNVTGVANSMVQKQKLSIFPNPAESNVTVVAKLDSNESGMIKILSTNGAVCFSEPFAGKMINKTISTKDIKQGVYFLLVENSKSREVQKLIIK